MSEQNTTEWVTEQRQAEARERELRNASKESLIEEIAALKQRAESAEHQLLLATRANNTVEDENTALESERDFFRQQNERGSVLACSLANENTALKAKIEQARESFKAILNLADGGLSSHVTADRARKALKELQ